ncbi:Na+/H+ antiporter subunit E [Agrobacterium vitis]|uniref:Na+/H+ antiporter subunit E n=1 Tax=Agrobacterium vitis TaxID=373 RepID=UPI00087212D8|nr:Na+/H+ antiporter subunit E [Agrobacterium vitis]MCE6075941.1 Na+/H+ antiporter subunit E [Agrobacterium vitis]MCM2468421.1 Na+/H+ antiporter subunit E [Agrobacterium vitis]MUO70588.1 Na+/H+ antiporter subunit E [Agrobacterium vitis]MUO82692.1 Na+/H+ antiporter subunit E [Agrobacterium vitis]MVA33124.1 Na+/H+ antiporter subunit E [Agrobacterium vitis]
MLPYPVLSLSLVVMWLLLNGFTLGHLILGIFVAVFAGWAMASLRPEKPRLRKWYLLPKLFLVVLYDIAKSNIAVAAIIIRSGSRQHDPGFVIIQLEIRSQFALAVLAVILTSTPGSAWLEYDSNDNSVLLHVLDIKDEVSWRDTIKNRYEKLLLEIFA